MYIQIKSETRSYTQSVFSCGQTAFSPVGALSLAMAIDYIMAKTRSRSFSLNPGVGATVQEQEQDFQVIQAMLKPSAGVGV